MGRGKDDYRSSPSGFPCPPAAPSRAGVPDAAAALLRAVDFAAFKHRDQKRKDVRRTRVAKMLTDAGITDVATLQAAVLHDTVEDTATTFEEVAAGTDRGATPIVLRQLENEFGPEVAEIVRECTDDKTLEKSERKRRQVETAPHKSAKVGTGSRFIFVLVRRRPFRRVKLADKVRSALISAKGGKAARLYNLRDLQRSVPERWTAERVQEYFRWAKQVTDSCAAACPRLAEQLEELYAAGTFFHEEREYKCLPECTARPVTGPRAFGAYERIFALVLLRLMPRSDEEARRGCFRDRTGTMIRAADSPVALAAFAKRWYGGAPIEAGRERERARMAGLRAVIRPLRHGAKWGQDGRAEEAGAGAMPVGDEGGLNVYCCTIDKQLSTSPLLADSLRQPPGSTLRNGPLAITGARKTSGAAAAADGGGGGAGGGFSAFAARETPRNFAREHAKSRVPRATGALPARRRQGEHEESKPQASASRAVRSLGWFCVACTPGTSAPARLWQGNH
ncbi:MAG: hypothetical protein BJ554DRAFT_7996 [Olpidium bornovanus]|uniref:HD domain-containing protein n=1 Tax=Olpidium bornovanus TaxID=278681 RepID=A0A8H8DJE4_9FUNG|nr:MAG: hypothetical protein BJ554DRAFT_7996 [Olpidium bornovanus]